ncbi:MAG: serine protease [Acidobacteria bacterium]|nr:serine protease [Acidobacteriota bacterium]
MYHLKLLTDRLAPICCAVFLTVLPHNADGQTAQQIARKVFGSTVLLVMADASGQLVSLGSGFFVREGEIASNLHVIEGASRGYAKLVGEKTKYDIAGITGIDRDRDLVLLRVSTPRSLPLSFGNSDAVQVGEPVYAVGNPQGLEGTFSQGIVSSIREVGSERLLQITAPISPGSSGGPVLDSRGQVIGVSVATFRGGQNLNFAIPSNYLKALLAKAGPPKPLSSAKSPEKQRSILADLGGRSTEGVVGSHFAWSGCRNCGIYSFSLRNQLRDNVRDVHCLVVFYDSQGNPIDVDVVRYYGLIPAGLSKRVESKVHGSVQELTADYRSKPPTTRVEFRILDFRMAE